MNFKLRQYRTFCAQVAATPVGAFAPVVQLGGRSLSAMCTVAVLSLAACGYPALQNSTAEVSGTSEGGISVEFNAGELADWTERSFAGSTEYTLASEDDRSVLRATTRSSASLLFRRQQVDLAETPVLQWSWKITNTFKDDTDAGNGGASIERTKAGDDFPARIYVVYQPGILPTEAFAINYVWSSHEPVDAHWPNPFQPKARMLVVETGDARSGQWVTVTRNVKQDFKQLFDIDTDTLHGFAVMVDGDNTGNSTTSWFDFLRFQAGNTVAAN